MKTSVIPSARLAVLPLALAAALPAAAQPSLRDNVVTATRGATRADELVSDVKVIDRRAIEDSTARTLPELLARLGGLQMSASGGLGKTSSVFIRGTENRHTILLVDGVRLGSATTGTPSWDNIPVEMIERIEILKGPASALYGSEGVGGVVQIFTRKGREGFHPYAAVTLGSESHRSGSAGVAAGQGALTYALGVQSSREKGFSATNPRVPFGNHNPDRDPFQQNAANASLNYEFSKNWSVDGGMLYSDGKSAFDDGPGIDSRATLRDITAHLGVKGRPTPGWRTELRYARGDDTVNSIVANFPGAFTTRQAEWSWQNNIDSPLGVVLAGLEQRVQRVSGSTAYAVTDRTINAGYAGLNGSRGSHSWQANVRRDSNSQFGGSTTGFTGYGYRISPAWRFNVSYGTSFVAPSFNQLYFPGFSNPLLQSERGRNTDLGVTWAANGQEVKLVHFDNRIRGFITNTTLPLNVPRARIDGWTLGYQGKVGALALRASVDALDPRNELNGLQLPRRARQQQSLGADWEQGAWRYGASLLHVGQRYDDTANKAPLGSYTTLDVYTDWQVAPAWSLQAKLNNLTDRQYETALGYNQPGRSFYLTLRWQPR